jgi:hypothetical protein
VKTYVCNASRSHGGSEGSFGDDNVNFMTDDDGKLVEFAARYRAWNILHDWDIKHLDYPYEIMIFVVLDNVRFCLASDGMNGEYKEEFFCAELADNTPAQDAAITAWLETEWVNIKAQIDARALQMVKEEQDRRVARAKQEAADAEAQREQKDREKLAELLRKYAPVKA